MRRLYIVLLAGLFIVAAVGARPIAGWIGSDGQAASVVQAQASPTPTLGATPQTGPNPPGAGDGDPQDFDQAPLVVIGLIVLIVLVGGMVLLSGWRRRRGSRE
ncbi:hypothetical protein GCM10029976_039400 [Kribbella albertanoniae]|uniref:Uncharacterized protein n=1 Tax=Kribbella albertanoniae TaxID=1266829 RepID=A0A4R4QA89_9ACTN|nr:hypothetical protein [Kribbella albertanoniae]TDC32296.1 hypothetical protein E1261_08805 [Kribbella albertanoniae]